MDAMVEEILEICDSTDTDDAAIARDRLRIDTRKWLMAKLAPRKYGDRLVAVGDRLVAEHVGPNGGPEGIQRMIVDSRGAQADAPSCSS